MRDIEFKPEWMIGENHCQLYTMADAEFVPALCGSRINYDKYSTDKTKFSVGFASPVGQLLSCNHIYSQYVFIDDVQKTMQKLEEQKIAAAISVSLQQGELPFQKKQQMLF